MRLIFAVVSFFLLTISPASAVDKCFFESDCPQDYTCVTAKGAVNGACQHKNAAIVEDKKQIKVDSIINEQGKCTFNTDCPDGGQCIKKPGSLYGTCEGSGYTSTLVNPGPLDRKRTCFFNQDCKPGQICTKPQGSFKGVCEDDLFQSSQDSKDPRTVLKNQFRTSNKQCLQDGDCGIREACVSKEHSVFGTCTAKSVIAAQATTPLPSSTSSSSTSNKLFDY